MPKIRIREKDLTTNPLVGSTTNDILVVNSELVGNGTAPKLIETEELEKLKNNDSLKQFLTQVLELGGRVVCANNWTDAMEYCGDRNQYDIKFILAKEDQEGTEEKTIEDDPNTEGVDESGTIPAKTELECALDIAQKRKDCVVVYTKINPDYTTNLTESNLLKNDCNYIKEDTKKEFFGDEVKTPVGKYVLPFYANGSSGVYGIDDSSIQLDAGQAYILAFLNNVAQGRAEWLAIAGSVRGAIPYNYKVGGFLKESEIDNMQLRTYDKENLIAINPIVNMNPWGTRIWGNRTCLPNENVGTFENDQFSPDANSDQLVASSFANIRIAICDIKKALYKAARKYQFEQNTDVLWVNFTSEVNSLLEEMKSSYGIVGYRWRRDVANERAKIKATLKIVPIEAVEDFDLTIELSDSLENSVQVAE